MRLKKVRPRSRITPKSLISWTMFKITCLNLQGKGLSFLMYETWVHLVPLRRLLQSHQRKTESRSVCKLVTSSNFVTVLCKLRSSAYRRASKVSTTLVISRMNKIKSKGPRSEPCRTPDRLGYEKDWQHRTEQTGNG